jgi:hypothetical protein
MFFDIFELLKLVFNYFQQYFSYICGENLTIHCENHQPAESFWQTLCTLINLHQAYLAQKGNSKIQKPHCRKYLLKCM